jgi:hypothetical protein
MTDRCIEIHYVKDGRVHYGVLDSALLKIMRTRQAKATLTAALVKAGIVGAAMATLARSKRGSSSNEMDMLRRAFAFGLSMRRGLLGLLSTMVGVFGIIAHDRPQYATTWRTAYFGLLSSKGTTPCRAEAV